MPQVVYFGSLHQVLLKSLEPGSVEMMQTQEHNKSLDAPDGSYLLILNFKIQDSFVEPSGTHSTAHSTGVVHSAMV